MNRWQWFQLFLFQAFWLMAVLGRNTWLLLLFLLLIVHFFITPTRSADIKVIILAFLGILVDASLMLLGVFKFNQPPLWLIALWFEFALSIGHGFIYLRRINIYYLSAIGAVAGNYAYLLSWKLGAVELPFGPLFSGLIIALVWALVLPFLVKTDLWIREGL